MSGCTRTRRPTLRLVDEVPAARGVTLLELIISVAILGTVASLLYGTFSRTWAGRVYAESRAASYATARLAVGWIERDIAAGGVVSGFPDGPALFVSKGLEERPSRDLDKPLLHMTTASALGTAPIDVALGKDIPLPGPQRGGQARVLYRLEREQPQDKHLTLVRYEWRPPNSLEREHAARAELASDIVSVRLRFSLNGSEWVETWEAGTGRSNVLPKIVETRLIVADSSGRPIEFVSATSIVAGGQ